MMLLLYFEQLYSNLYELFGCPFRAHVSLARLQKLGGLCEVGVMGKIGQREEHRLLHLQDGTCEFSISSRHLD